MKAIARFLILAVFWFLIVALEAIGQHVHVTGALVDPVGTTLVLDNDTPQSFRYTFPKASVNAAPPGRLQTVLPIAQMTLYAEGSYSNPSSNPLEWMTFAGVEYWWSIGSPADSPDAPHAWGGIKTGYDYGDDTAPGASGTYFGAGMIYSLNSQRYIDPTKERELRAFIGAGFVDLFLNLRRSVDVIASGHWDHEHRIRVVARAEPPVMTMRYAEAHEPLYRHVTSPWGEVAWTWGQKRELLSPDVGASTVAFPISEATPATLACAPIGDGPWSDVLLQAQQRLYVLNGVENTLGTQAVCGGSGVIFGTVSDAGFASDLLTQGGAPGVGSMQVGLTGFDGSMDWSGSSGQWTPSSSFGSYNVHWRQLFGADAQRVASQGFNGTLRVHGTAEFRPEQADARIAWSARAGQRMAIRQVGRQLLP